MRNTLLILCFFFLLIKISSAQSSIPDSSKQHPYLPEIFKKKFFKDSTYLPESYAFFRSGIMLFGSKKRELYNEIGHSLDLKKIQFSTSIFYGDKTFGIKSTVARKITAGVNLKFYLGFSYGFGFNIYSILHSPVNTFNVSIGIRHKFSKNFGFMVNGELGSIKYGFSGKLYGFLGLTGGIYYSPTKWKAKQKMYSFPKDGSPFVFYFGIGPQRNFIGAQLYKDSSNFSVTRNALYLPNKLYMIPEVGIMVFRLVNISYAAYYQKTNENNFAQFEGSEQILVQDFYLFKQNIGITCRVNRAKNNRMLLIGAELNNQQIHFNSGIKSLREHNSPIIKELFIADSYYFSFKAIYRKKYKKFNVDFYLSQPIYGRTNYAYAQEYTSSPASSTPSYSYGYTQTVNSIDQKLISNSIGPSFLQIGFQLCYNINVIKIHGK